MKTKTIIQILGLAGFTVLADNWVVSPILPAIAAAFSTDISRAGLLITAYMLPFGLFQLVFGPLADRFGKRQVINTAMLFFSISAMLCATAGSLTQLTIYRGLTGVFAAAVIPISLALIGDLVPLAQRQQAIGFFMGIAFLGQGLSMAIGGAVAHFLNWRGVFVVYALLAIIPTALLFYMGGQIPSGKNPGSRLLAPYLSLLSNSVSLRTYLVILLEGILIIGTFSYLGAYIASAYHYSFLYIGLIMTVFGVIAVLGGRLSGALAARWGRRAVLTLVLGVALLGLGFILAHSTLLTMATEFAAQSRGAAMSLVAFCFMGGGGLGTALGGSIIAAGGFTNFFLIFTAGLGLLVLATPLLVQTGESVKTTGEAKT